MIQKALEFMKRVLAFLGLQDIALFQWLVDPNNFINQAIKTIVLGNPAGTFRKDEPPGAIPSMMIGAMVKVI
jgi:hypothetical protein